MKYEMLSKLVAVAVAASVVAVAAIGYSASAEEKAKAPAPAAAPLDEKRVLQLIDERLKAAGKTMSDKEFNARVEKGIQAFIAKQQQDQDKQRQAQEERSKEMAKNVPPPSKTEHMYGNPNAPITLIEYSDFECPYCKGFQTTVKQLIDDSKGEINWVYRHFPLDFHNPGAQKQAEASECAAELGGNDVFWKYALAVYDRTKSGGRGFAMEALVPLAVELGLNKDKFQTCLDSNKYADKVRQNVAEGANSGVNGTPGNIFYHNKTKKTVLVSGAMPGDMLRNTADELKKD